MEAPQIYLSQVCNYALFIDARFAFLMTDEEVLIVQVAKAVQRRTVAQPRWSAAQTPSRFLKNSPLNGSQIQ